MDRIKRIDIPSNMDIDNIEGTAEWYIARNSTYDVYGALECINNSEEYSGDEVYLIHYPDGKTYMPFEKNKNICITNPIWNNGVFYIMKIDLINRICFIYEYIPKKNCLNLKNRINIGDKDECYNLNLKGMPLSVIEEDGENFKIIWPENKNIVIGSNESFLFRNKDELYFERWFDDISIKEETVVRNIKTGEIVKVIDGRLFIMPNNVIWQL